MQLPTVIYHFDFSNLINNYFVPDLSSQQKKVTAIALAIICAFTLCYYLYSSYFSRKKIIQNPEADTKIQQLFEEQIQEHSPSVKKSPLKKKETEKEVDTTISSKDDSPLKGTPLIEDVKEPELNAIEEAKNIALAMTDTQKEVYDDSQKEEIVSNEMIIGSSIDPVKENHLSTPYRAKLALITTSGGLVGPNFDKNNESQFINQCKLMDGKDLPIQPDTLLLEFGIFFPTDECASLMQFNDLEDVYSCFLPAFLFKDKKEGETVQLQYKGNIVQFELHQVAYSTGHLDPTPITSSGDISPFPGITPPYSGVASPISRESSSFSGNASPFSGFATPYSGVSSPYSGVATPTQSYTSKSGNFKFENIFASVFNTVLEDINCGELGFDDSLFEEHDPLECYTIDHGGKLYKLNQDSDLVEAHPEEFIELTDLDLKELATHINKWFIYQSDHDIVIQSQFCGIPDIVVNEKFLCLFKDKELYSPFSPSSLKIIPWRKYFNFSLEKMQAEIQKSKITLDDGVLVMRISTL